jgi:hypothetical protein
MIPYRHDVLSLNVTVLAGASGKAFAVKSNCPGSFHDTRVLQNSSLWQTMEVEKIRPYPEGIVAGKQVYEMLLKCH